MKKVLCACAAALAMATSGARAEGAASATSAVALKSFDSFAYSAAPAVAPLAKFHSFVSLEKLSNALERFRSDMMKGLMLIVF